jgi:hypothetical protein
MASFVQDLANRAFHEVYKHFQENPLHVVIELFLIGLIVFLLLQKAYKPHNRPEKLSTKVGCQFRFAVPVVVVFLFCPSCQALMPQSVGGRPTDQGMGARTAGTPHDRGRAMAGHP